MILTPHLIVLVGIIFVTSTVSDNSYKLIRPELYPTTTDSPNESIANADVGGPFDVLKGKSFKEDKHHTLLLYLDFWRLTVILIK